MISPIFKKIILIILVVSLGSILISGFFINHALNRQFLNYLDRVELAREEQILNILGDIYQENRGWPSEPTRLGMGRGNFIGNLHYVANLKGDTVLFTGQFLRNRNQTPHLRERSILVHNQKVGTAYFGSNPVQDYLANQNKFFRNTINRSIVFSIFFTSIISILIAYFLAKNFSAPLTEMSQIAKNMATGNLDSRVHNLPPDERGELGQSLNQLAERLKQVEELRKKMTADVAHDLRTPLATVHSHLEGMIDKVIPASSENLDSLLDEVKRLSGLVQDLQEIALTDSAVHQFKIEQIDLNQLLLNLVRNLTPLYQKKQVNLIFDSTQTVYIDSDHDALVKIFDNLLSNAYKYTPSGKQVTVSLTPKNDRVTVSIIDSGIGIDAQDLPYIFERFYRTDKSRNRESGGFGLGLTIVKELSEALGGYVTVTSIPETGSTFTVTLPISPQ